MSQRSRGRRPKKAIRDHVGEQLGICGREVDRLLRLLQAPVEVQLAYENGHVGIVAAGRVAGLPPEVQEEIAEELRERPEDAKAIIVPELPKGGENQWQGRRLLRKVMEFARDIVPELEGVVDQLRPYREPDVEPLKRAQALFAELVQKLPAVWEENGRR